MLKKCGTESNRNEQMEELNRVLIIKHKNRWVSVRSSSYGRGVVMVSIVRHGAHFNESFLPHSNATVCVFYQSKIIR